MAYIYVFYTLFAITCVYALWRGGPPERIAAGIFLLAKLLTHISVSALPVRFRHFEGWPMLVDLAMLVALLALSIAARRVWPMIVTAMQAAGVLAHLLPLAFPRENLWGYGFAVAIWAYAMCVVLSVGTWMHRRRLMRHGIDGSWKNFSGR